MLSAAQILNRKYGTSAVGVAATLAMLFSCGGKNSTETSEPAPASGTADGTSKTQNKPTTPVVNSTAVSNGASHSFWTAAVDSLELRHYDTAFKTLDTCHLGASEAFAGVKTGGVSALAFLDKTTLLALVDPGDGDEMVALVDLTTAPCHATVWYGPNESFSRIASSSIVPFPVSNTDYRRVFISRSNGADRFTWTAGSRATRAVGPGDSPFVAAAPSGPATCAAGILTGMAALGDGDNRLLILLTKGEGATRLNIVGSLMGGSSGNPQCLSSYDFAAPNLPTSSTDTPVQALQGSDKRIYVLYQNGQSGGKLIRYEFNGQSLMSPSIVSQDPDDVGYEPRAMASPQPGTLLIATGRFLTTLDAATGRLIRPWQDESWTSKISAITVDP